MNIKGIRTGSHKMQLINQTCTMYKFKYVSFHTLSLFALLFLISNQLEAR